MKQTIFTILFFTAIGLVSCKKDKYEPDIQQYDEDQITSYIKTNSLTGMTRDTSGMYYKILSPGTGTALQYTDSVAFVYTVKSFDGKYTIADTIINHYENYVGHIQQLGFPLGVQEAVHNLINHQGASIHVLVPSHLAYGLSGIGTGSSSVTNGRIAGNQSLDYYIHIISSQYDHDHSAQNAYDQLIIKNYIALSSSPNSWHQDVSGIWYSIATPGTGTVPITDNTTITATFTLRELNDTVIEDGNAAGGTAIDIPDLIPGMQIGLKKYATAGSLITFLIPSSLGTGKHADGSAPPNSCLRYEIQVIDVSP